MATTPALQTADDFRQVVVDYAAEATGLGAVYIEGIFSPAEPAARGVAWEEVFEGYCDGAQEARERLGVEINLTPDITRAFSPEIAEETATWCARYRDRGVVAVGLGGPEDLSRAVRRRLWPRPLTGPGLRAARRRGRRTGLRSAARSTRCTPTASATASAPSKTPRSWSSSPSGASCST